MKKKNLIHIYLILYETKIYDFEVYADLYLFSNEIEMSKC